MEKQEALHLTEEQLELPFNGPLYEQEPEEAVQEFMTAFDANTDPAFALKLIEEEAAEVEDAVAHLLKELIDLFYVSQYASIAGVGDAAISVYMPANLERLVTLFAPEVRREAFARVHRSNMSKLGDDGKPVRREDGKILKGPNYQEPYLLDLV